jgi:hypothetical protein
MPSAPLRRVNFQTQSIGVNVEIQPFAATRLLRDDVIGIKIVSMRTLLEFTSHKKMGRELPLSLDNLNVHARRTKREAYFAAVKKFVKRAARGQFLFLIFAAKHPAKSQKIFLPPRFMSAAP